MAIKKTVTTLNNFGTETTLPDTYIRVDRVVGGKAGLHANAVFMSPEADRVFFERSFEFLPQVGANAKDFIAQSYEHIKSLDEFKDAVDC